MWHRKCDFCIQDSITETEYLNPLDEFKLKSLGRPSDNDPFPNLKNILPNKHLHEYVETFLEACFEDIDSEAYFDIDSSEFFVKKSRCEMVQKLLISSRKLILLTYIRGTVKPILVSIWVSTYNNFNLDLIFLLPYQTPIKNC